MLERLCQRTLHHLLIQLSSSYWACSSFALILISALDDGLLLCVPSRGGLVCQVNDTVTDGLLISCDHLMSLVMFILYQGLFLKRTVICRI